MFNIILIILVFLFFFIGIRIIRPIEVGLIERLGKYKKTGKEGFHWIIPIIDRMIKINMTEQMVDVHPQTVITRDKLNALVDCVVYYQVKDAKAAAYNVDDHQRQLVSLARTTLRAVIGKMTLTDANENRDEINRKVEGILSKETKSYGVDVLRVEIMKIEPPKDVQESMNKVVKAEQEKIAALDTATAFETKADGERRADIKRAEGKKQASVLEAEGQAVAIKDVAEARALEIELINASLQKHFKGQAEVYKKLETVDSALRNGSKYVIDSQSNITNVISDVAGITPITKKKVKE